MVNSDTHFDVSIIICCYNSQERIPVTLNHIFNQNCKNYTFEVILVNNNSTDDTVKIAQKVWNNFQSIVPLKIVNELRPGQSFARRTGVSYASGDYILFCDDDNWLDTDYILRGLDIFKTNKKIGIIGGWTSAVFQSPPPDWFESVGGSFAVGGYANQSLSRVDFVWGAGMYIEKNLAQHIFSKDLFTEGRSGNNLGSGDDKEICERALELGYIILKSNQLHLKHFITTDRLSWSYVKKLHIGFGYSATKTAYLEYRQPIKYIIIQLVRSIYIIFFNPKDLVLSIFFRRRPNLNSLKFYALLGNWKYLTNNFEKKN